MEANAEITAYKGTRTLPNIEKYNSEYEVKKHQIFTNRHRYPDRVVVSEYTDTLGITHTERRLVPLNRIGLPYQKKIVNIATTFLCGEPVKYTNQSEDTALFDAFQKVLTKNKIKFADKEIATAVGRFTECAELWYHLPEENEDYGVKSSFRLKIKVLTPDKYRLYPVFDENDELVSFSREFIVDDKTIFEAYTSAEIIRWENEKGRWTETLRVANPIGKIPVVFYQQEAVEWAEVQTAIERLEQIYSYSAESNDKFAFPILKLRGKVDGRLSRDDTGKVLQLEEGADADFVVPPNANESLGNETDRLERDVHDFTATPNISFDNMKGLGNMLAGSSAQFLFLSAHLKVMDKLAIYIPAFQRRASIVGAYLKFIVPSLHSEELAVEPVITPFIIDNEAEFVRFLMEANGNQPIYSQRHTMERAGVKDPEAMQEQIREEQEQDKAVSF